MPRDGSGGYDRVTGTPYVASTTIDETIVNNEMADLGAEIANSLSKDGQTVPTANQPMGGYKHTGVGNATARDSYAALGQVQDGGSVYAAAGGTGDVLTLTLSPAPAAYAAGQEFRFKATATNTTAATINVNSLGAKDIKRDGSSALAAGDITSGQMYTLRYDGTNFQLLNASTFVTQASGNSTTLPATTAMVQAAITARAASDTAAGIIEIATDAEAQTATSTSLAITPANLKAAQIIRGTAVATTSGTSNDFTSIPSWAKRITVVLAGVSSTDNDPMLLQIGDSGGIETSSYVSVISAGATVAQATNGYLVTANSAGTTSNFCGAIHLYNCGSNLWICSGVTGSNGAYITSQFNGQKTLSGTLDRVRLTTFTGSATFDAGAYYVFYE